MSEVYFYHMTRTPLEATLPLLLTKSLEAGWKVLVRGTDQAMLSWLDEKLWLGDGFLPHGLAGGTFDADQPVLLTTQTGDMQGANALISVDGAMIDPGEVAALKRASILFDGNDRDAIAHARTMWKTLTSAGLPAQYWSQEGGRWEMKAQAQA
ncbi:MAG: DNA polymerase III subunit chi [Rhodobacteraceae bacterium]|nr:DNA polymerase III subunit chi [Paracoccaceae bacterium]